MVFEVTHGEFKGPLEVLLDLIEAKKLHISDLSLSRVTDDFLNYAKSHEGFPLAESAQFALVASTLLLIKSKSLLPNLALTTEEQGDIQDLERRLELLKRFRALSKHLKDRYGKHPLYLPNERTYEPVFAPPKELSLTTLLAAIRDVIASLPRPEVLAKRTIGKIVSLEEMIIKLKERVATALRMSFREFAASQTERLNVIVGFLAMLELVKEGTIGVTQDTLGGDIQMETGEFRTPRY
jgi:segregation and condensation protein A